MYKEDTDQWNRIKSPEINLLIYRQLIFAKEAKNTPRERIFFSQMVPGKTGPFHSPSTGYLTWASPPLGSSNGPLLPAFSFLFLGANVASLRPRSLPRFYPQLAIWNTALIGLGAFMGHILFQIPPSPRR